MSTRDGPSLSGREQAILDKLAAKMAAEDPSFLAALDGHRRRVPLPALPAPPPWVRHWLTGSVAAAVGLVLVVVSLSAGLVLGVLGAALLFAGVGVVVTSVAAMPRWWEEPAEAVPSEPGDPTGL